MHEGADARKVLKFVLPKVEFLIYLKSQKNWVNRISGQGVIARHCLLFQKVREPNAILENLGNKIT